MKVVGINASHNKDGNTKVLIQRVLSHCMQEGLETEYVSLADRELNYCRDCGECKSQLECVIDDDVNEINRQLMEADAIIVGSPTYFGGITGRLRTLFDRTLPLRRNGFKLSDKIGGAIAIGGSRNGGQEYTISDIHRWMLIQEMTVVGDVETAHFGGICIGRSPGDVLKDETGLETVDNLAERVIQKAKDKP